MASQSFGFIGAGQMARALAQGFVSAGLVDPQRISAFDPLPAALSEFTGLIGGSEAGLPVAVGRWSSDPAWSCWPSSRR